MLVLTTGPRYFRYAGGPSSRQGASFLPEVFGSPCLDEATSTPNGIALEEISLPFSEPLAWPLEIRSQ